MAAVLVTASAAAADVGGLPEGSLGAREVMLVANAEGGTVSIIDARRPRVLREIDILPDGAEPGLTDNPTQALLGQQVVEAAGGKNYAQDQDVSPDGRTLYVSRGHRGDVAAFDIRSGRLLWKVAIPGVRSDHMTISDDGSRLYVSALTEDEVEVIDTRTHAIVRSFPSGQWPHDNHVSPDGARVYNGSIGNIVAPEESREAAAAGESPYQLTVVDSTTLDTVRSYAFERGIRPYVITHDERRMYAQLSEFHGVVKYGLEDDRILRRRELPIDEGVTEDDYDFEAPHHGLAITPDEKTLCAAGRASDYVALLSTRRLRPIAIIEVDDAPGWAAVSPRGNRCFVANTRADTLSVISFAKRREIRRLEVGDGPKQIEAARLARRAVCTLPRILGCTTKRRALHTAVAAAKEPEHPTPPGPEFQGDPAEYASAFAAKEICSRALIAGRDPAPIINDLRGASALAPGFAIDTAEIEIDRAGQRVTVSHPGQPPRTAVRARDQGCVIAPAYSGRLHFKPRALPWHGPPRSARWPVGERIWHGRSNINQGLLDAALDTYIRREGARALVVVHEGELVGERYAAGFGPFVQQRSWSSAKSITASIVGLLVDRRKLHLDRRPPLLREWNRDERREITLRNLLNMSSGLKQNQYEGTANSLQTFTPESEHAFVYFDGFDTYADALEAPLEVPPNTRWQYRNANVLSAAASAKRVLARAGKNFSAWAQRHLLEPLGMRTTTLETDPYGQFIASGTAFTTARDLARLGLVHLQNGRWDGRRFLSRRWARFVHTPAPTASHYGGFWWINSGQEAFPSLPPDTYYASGAFGQAALVIPSHNLVIARMGWNVPDDDVGLDAFARLVLLAAE
jgi:CubicO group peptidase (beta-lactamase class C family)/DNA-binding beta-propeller fold protein YncE